MSNWTDYPADVVLPWELAFTDLEDLPQEQLDEIAAEGFVGREEFDGFGELGGE